MMVTKLKMPVFFHVFLPRYNFCMLTRSVILFEIKQLKLLFILFLIVFMTGCKSSVTSPEEKTQPEFTSYAADFDSVWANYEKYYPLFSYKKVNWRETYSVYKDKFNTNMNAGARNNILSEMLGILKDEHIYLISPDGRVTRPYLKQVSANNNPVFLSHLINTTNWHQENSHWGWERNGKIGYIVFNDFFEQSIDTIAFSRAMDSLRETDGIIIDIRTNSGGNLLVCESLWNRFSGKETIVGYYVYRNGLSYDDFALKEYVRAQPQGPWQYTKKVAILIGKACGSGGEIFAETFSHFDNAILIGETTRGSVVAPAEFKLPDSTVYSVPMVAYYNTNGFPLEGNGVEPDIKMNFYDPDHYNSADDLIYEYAVNYINGQKAVVKNFKPNVVLPSKLHKPSGSPEIIKKAIRSF